LVISDDLDEVLALSDRVLVMRLGRVVEAFDRDAMSREAVLDLLTVESRAA
jgi:ABC-type sugar transport system ATPase subunit